MPMHTAMYTYTHTMEPNISEPIEVEVNIPERVDGEGILCPGIYGGTDMKAMADRQRRLNSYKKRMEYRECVPCDRCCTCIEMRGFYPNGKERIIGLLCMSGEFETTPFNTCSSGRRSSTGRKRVVYDMTNAPKGFALGLGNAKSDLEYMSPGDPKRIKETSQSQVKEYIGGSSHYKRADGKVMDEASKEIPKGLMN